jgi:hypothetical protein
VNKSHDNEPNENESEAEPDDEKVAKEIQKELDVRRRPRARMAGVTKRAVRIFNTNVSCKYSLTSIPEGQRQCT